jgi:hypothetical protein
MGMTYGSARAMWLGTRNPLVDDTTVTFVAGCVSAAVFDLPPTASPVRLSMAMTAKTWVTDSLACGSTSEEASVLGYYNPADAGT